MDSSFQPQVLCKQQTVQWRFIVPLVVISCGSWLFLVILPVSYWCWRKRIGGHLAPSIFFASLTIPLLIVPGIAREAIRVTSDGISIHGGIWFAPEDRHISLAKIDSIIETLEDVPQRGASRWDRFWEFRYRSAPPQRLHLSDLFGANRDQVARYLRWHGIHTRTKPSRGSRIGGSRRMRLSR